MPSGVRRFVGFLVVALALAAAFVTSAGAVYYTPPGGSCVVPPGAYVSGYNSWTVNVVQIAGLCPAYYTVGTTVGLYYIRPNGTYYEPLYLFYTHSMGNYTLVDPRNISYGRAVCKNWGSYSAYFNYCYAGT